MRYKMNADLQEGRGIIGVLPSRDRAIRVAAAGRGRAAWRREAATRPLIVRVGKARRGTPAHRMSQPLNKGERPK